MLMDLRKAWGSCSNQMVMQLIDEKFDSLESRLAQLEREQSKEDVARDRNGQRLIPRQSVLESTNHKAGNEGSVSAEFLFMGIRDNETFKAIDLRFGRALSYPSKECFIWSYNMAPCFAEAIIAAAEKKEDC